MTTPTNPPPTAPASAEPKTCIECGGPLQWRCPACRIAQSAQAAMPAERVALSEEQCRKLWKNSPFRGNGGQCDWFIEGVRAAERAHGITPAQGKETQG